MEREFTFPNSMVDRVTPRTVEADIAYIAQTFGYRDGTPVTCEPFHQWVMEDSFADGRPALEEVGVEVVHDVEPLLADLRGDLARARPELAALPFRSILTANCT
jgi:mannitol 2-dehydrogenase